MAQYPDFPGVVSTSQTPRLLVLGEAKKLNGPGSWSIIGTVNTANGSWTLTLPPLAECNVGDVVYIYATVANSKALTVEDHYADGGLASDLTLDTDGDDVAVMCVGTKWIEIYNSIA